MLAAMIYRPGQTTARARGGGWTCARFFGEIVASGAHVKCRQSPAQPRVIASPAAGCAFWMREPGTD
jgi:hypothetical protein